MSLISSVMLVQSDPRLGAGLRYSFEREGTAVRRAEPGPTLKERLVSDCQLIVTGTPDRDAGLSLLVELRRALAARSLRIPVLYVGNGLSREEALDVGATEFLPPPVYVRDVITMARILCSPIKELNSAVTGELSDHFGLFYIVRALSAVNRKGVLTLVRGLRRGELRFFEGEVTSAQVGMLHGLAALHQLLLWTDARFELRPENVVRRQQIPLSPAELLENSQEFLRDIREVAEGMSPSSVYKPDTERAAKAMTNAPDEVRTVYRLFDGNRSVADVIEDSPYRVFETLRVANRLKTYGAIAKVAKEKKGGARTALAIEEWLVDGGSTGTLPPVTAPTQSYGRRKKKKRRRDASPSPGSATSPSAPVDWGSLPDRRTGVSDGDPFSPVVPSASASGEINAVRQPAEPLRRIEPAARAAVEVAPVVEPPPPRPPEPEPEPEPVIDLAEIPDLSGQWETDAEMDAETPLPPPDDVERPVPVRTEPMVASGEIAARVPRILIEPAGPAIVIDESVGELTAPHVAPPPPAQIAPTPAVSEDPDTSAVPVPIPKTPTQPHAAPPPPGAEPAAEPAEPVTSAAPEPVKSAAPEPVKVAAETAKAAAPEPVKVAAETAKAAAPPPVKAAAPEPVKAAAPEPVKAAAETVKAAAPPPVKAAVAEPVKPAAPEPVKPAAPEPAKLVSPEPPPSPHSVAVPPPSPFAKEREAPAPAAAKQPPPPAAAAKEPPPAAAAAKARAATPAPAAGRKKRKSTQPPIDEKDAFTDAEHAFFSAGTEVEPSAEDSFEDLDEDYEVPRSFWQRLLSRPDQTPRRKR